MTQACTCVPVSSDKEPACKKKHGPVWKYLNDAAVQIIVYLISKNTFSYSFFPKSQLLTLRPSVYLCNSVLCPVWLSLPWEHPSQQLGWISVSALCSENRTSALFLCEYTQTRPISWIYPPHSQVCFLLSDLWGFIWSPLCTEKHEAIELRVRNEMPESNTQATERQTHKKKPDTNTAAFKCTIVECRLGSYC